jgi:hypothetical protein
LLVNELCRCEWLELTKQAGYSNLAILVSFFLFLELVCL